VVASDGRPCYAGTFVQTFVHFLKQHPVVGPRLAEMPPVDPDQRIPISVAHELLGQAIEMTGDQDLGLKVGRTVSPGDAGVADFAMRSASTVHEAILVAGRYIRLVNDALELRIEAQSDRVMLLFESQVVMPRAAEDFLMSGMYTNHMSLLLHDAPELECRFTHPEPSDSSEYARTFGTGHLRFAAPATGFAFDASYLDKSVENADPKLHSVLRQHAETLLSSIPASRSLTDRVRHQLLRDLSRVRPTAAWVAGQLHMSARTLERRLEREGTTFGIVLDDLRRRAAFSHLARRDLCLGEIAFLLGFSHVGAFHRAFKRWTGTTPLEYRRKLGKDPSAADTRPSSPPSE
jgi:AraC-like DNA-binding protein